MPRDNEKSVSKKVEQLRQEIDILLNNTKNTQGGGVEMLDTLERVRSLAGRMGFDLDVDGVDAPGLAAQQRKMLEQFFKGMGFRNASIRNTANQQQQEVLSRLREFSQNSGIGSGGTWSVVIHPVIDARGLSPKNVLAQANAAEIEATNNDARERNDLVFRLRMTPSMSIGGGKPNKDNELGMALRYAPAPALRPSPF